MKAQTNQEYQMEWSGKLTKPEKYSNSTWNGIRIGFVQVVQNAYYDEEGELTEKYSAHLYDADEIMLETYIPLKYYVCPTSLADYVLCAIQDEKAINVQK